jgi:hypothetical protein
MWDELATRQPSRDEMIRRHSEALNNTERHYFVDVGSPPELVLATVAVPRDHPVTSADLAILGSPMNSAENHDSTALWTIGHSTHDWDAFAEILRNHQIETLCDIRSWPGSRKFPQFNREEMDPALAAAGIEYRWMGRSLGGHRKKTLGDQSPNLGLRVAGFRNYADYMQTEAFNAGLEELIGQAKRSRTAVMCAEALSHRCHRRLLSDALAARGVRVIHILDREQEREHVLSEEAKIGSGGTVTYPPEGDLLQGG